MLRATRALLAKSVKRTTGITGVDVVPDARNVLIGLYERTLQDIKIIPEHATYRQVVEEFTNQRLAAVKQHEDVEMIEDAIGCGQAEELIEAAKNELILIPQYASWKMWEKKRPTPNDDEYEGLFNDMENADPESLQGPLKAYAKSQREHADARRAAAAAAAKPAAPAPVPGALPAGKP